MNLQKPEPRVKDGEGENLDFHSMFFTIQGEGPFSGHRAVFIRLAGCNLQCPGCDTEYTQGRHTMRFDRLAEAAHMLAANNRAHACLIVITGGEPLRQKIGLLVRDLVNLGHLVQIESNGVFSPDRRLIPLLTHAGKLVSLVISPKTTVVNATSAELACAFKYVLDANSMNWDDGLPIKALEHPASRGVARPPSGIPVYVNPFDTGDEEQNRLNRDAVKKSAMQFGYIAGLQIHKILNVE